MKELLLDYFAVGRDLAVRSKPLSTPHPEEKDRYVLELAILEPGPNVLGSAAITLRHYVDVSFRWSAPSISAENQIEAMLLIANICRKAMPVEIRMECSLVED